MVRRLILSIALTYFIPMFGMIGFFDWWKGVLPNERPSLSELREMTKEYYGNAGVPGDPNANAPAPNQEPAPINNHITTGTIILAGCELMVIIVVVYGGIQTGVLSTENIRAVGRSLWENSGKWLGRR
jgi:hypothetical protein